MIKKKKLKYVDGGPVFPVVGGLFPTLVKSTIQTHPATLKHAGFKGGTDPVGTQGMLGFEDAKQQMLKHVNSPAYKKKLENELSKSDYGEGKTTPTAEELQKDRSTILEKVPTMHYRDTNYNFRQPHEAFGGKELWQEAGPLGQTYVTSYGHKVDDSGKKVWKPKTGYNAFNTRATDLSNTHDPKLGITYPDAKSIGNVIGLEESAHVTQDTSEVESNLNYPLTTVSEGKEYTYNQGITPYAQKVIKAAGASGNWDPQLANTKEYLGRIVEVGAKRTAVEVDLINKGVMKEGDKFTKKQYNYLLKNPTMVSDHLLKYTSGVDKPHETLQDPKNKKLKKESFKRLQTMMNEIALNETYKEDDMKNKPVAKFGGKFKYLSGGITNNTSATSIDPVRERTINTQPAEDQALAGNIISGVGAAATLIPGPGPIIGAGLGLIGGIVTATAKPTVSYKPAENLNPYGYNLGGRIKYTKGGQLNQISEDAVEVQANNPNTTDSVETSKVMLDHNEVITKDKVFSDSLTNPATGNSFAKDESRNQKLLGKFQKNRGKSGDTEFKDEEFLNRNSDALFQQQEAMAMQMGLRNPDGTPVQKKEGMKFGGKVKYLYGGPGGPGNPWNPTEDPTQLFTTGLGTKKSPFLPAQTIQAGETDMTQPWQQSQNMFNFRGRPIDANSRIKDTTEIAPRTLGQIKNPQQYSPEQLAMNDPNASPLLLTSSPKSTGINFDPTYGKIPLIEDSKTSQFKSENVNNSDVESALNGDTGKGSSLYDWTKETPLGAAGTLVGLGTNIAGILGNKPSLVSYNNVGAEERKLQNQARAQLVEGRSQALQDSLAQGRIARANIGSRSFQSFTANQRNVARGVTEDMARIRGAFADKLAQADMTTGQRRTALEQINQQKNMMVDDINTREMDAVKTENMQMGDNIRKLMIEGQFAQNSYKKNQILKNLLESKNYKFDSDEARIKFITELYKNEKLDK